MSTLSNALHERPITPCTRRDIVEHLWPIVNGHKARNRESDWGAYFEYYHDQCAAAMHEQGEHIIARTHQHIIEIATKLKECHSRSAIKAELKDWFTGATQRLDEDEILDNTIDLATRLYLMINIGAYHSTITQGTRLLWNNSNTQEFLHENFQRRPGPSETNMRFEKDFTAINMQQIADIRICWTNNLLDHLRMVDDDRVVAVFHHASFLQRQQENSLFPDGFIEETMRTLALLFPRDDRRDKKWLHKAHKSLEIDGLLMHCDRLRVEDRQIPKFEYWNDRLVILKQAFDESRPVKIKQWWYDRRDGHAWYTFWIALFVLFMTLFFGLIQSVESALQVYKAYHPA